MWPKILLLLFLLCPLGQGAKILFFFAGGTYSHKVSVWPFVTAIAERHNVTFMSAFAKQPYPHAAVLDIAPKAMIEAMGRQFQNVDRVAERQRGEENNVLLNYHRDILRACEAIFGAIPEEPDLYRLFHGNNEEDQFDLIINNAVFGDCGYVMAHRQMERGAKLIIYDSTNPLFWWADMFGYPTDSAWVPEANNIRDYPMNFYERFTNYLTPISWYVKKQWELFPPLEAMMKKIYNLKQVPSLMEVERSASLIFIASHYSMDYARSLPPFVVHVGGMQCWQKEKPLEGEFKEFLDDAKDGAILIAFGSTIDLSTMPQEFKKIFFDMMTKFPKLKFIWRWNGPLPEYAPKNLKVAQWLPQYEILAHPNLKLFVSHAGLNSLTEATYQGKPVILLPLFADQDYNGFRVQAYEIGIRLEIRTLTATVMENAVREILTNKKYTENMKKMSGMMRDRPMSPIESAIWWSEFVLRHNDTSALKPLNRLNCFQNRLWDVFFVLFFVAAIFLYGLIKTICWAVRRLLQKSEPGKVKENKNLNKKKDFNKKNK